MFVYRVVIHDDCNDIDVRPWSQPPSVEGETNHKVFKEKPTSLNGAVPNIMDFDNKSVGFLLAFFTILNIRKLPQNSTSYKNLNNSDGPEPLSIF